MKRILIAASLILSILFSNAQSISINTDGSNPDSSSVLDIKSNNKGLLIPRMTKAEKLAIVRPANGLIIYQIDESAGIWFYNSNKWSFLQDNLGDHSMLENLRTNGKLISKNGDNVGIQLQDSGTVSIKGLIDIGYTVSPMEVLRFDKNGGILSKGSIGVGKIPVEGPGNRFMWYPYKQAFRAGHAREDEWNDSKTGFYSWAGGYGTTASEIYSLAMGYDNISSGVASVALGAHNKVFSLGGFVSGIGNYVPGYIATGLGYNTRALGSYSTSTGLRTIASADASSTFGTGTVTKGFSSAAFGMYNDSLLANNTGENNIPFNQPLFIVGNGNSHTDRRNAVVVRKDGVTELSRVRVGQGTIISRQQYGTAYVGHSTSALKTITITFPVEFPSVPTITATVKAQAGTDYNDVFVASVRSINTREVTFNVLRVDTKAGWGQFINLDWMAVAY